MCVSLSHTKPSNSTPNTDSSRNSMAGFTPEALLWRFSHDDTDFNLNLNLNLCLSLGGLYARDKPPLVCSVLVTAAERPLARTCSLPEEDTAKKSPPAPAWDAESTAKSAALARTISRIKTTQTCRSYEGQEFSVRAEERVILQKSAKRVRTSSNWSEVMTGMPSVTTTGDRPNGKRVDIFLYKYSKGQVSIVCVCHGSFLSRAGGKWRIQ